MQKKSVLTENKENCKILINKIEIQRNNNLKKLLLIFAGVCLIGLINPSGLTPYTYILKSASGNMMHYLNEHKPVTFSYLAENKPYIIVYFLTIFILMYPKHPIKLHDIFLLLGLTFMTFFGVRQIAILVIISVSIWAKYFEEIKIKFFGLKIFKGEKFLSLRILATIIVLLAIFTVSYKYYKMNENRNFVEEDSYPIKASNWIKENLNLENLRIFNNYTDGSYLVFAGIPNFVDTRCDLFTAEFNNTLEKNNDIFTDSMRVQENPSCYKEIFKKYDINSALISKNELYIAGLEYYEDFKKVYEDEFYIVYVKELNLIK